jgi:hypothetical protein
LEAEPRRKKPIAARPIIPNTDLIPVSWSMRDARFFDILHFEGASVDFTEADSANLIVASKCRPEVGLLRVLKVHSVPIYGSRFSITQPYRHIRRGRDQFGP